MRILAGMRMEEASRAVPSCSLVSCGSHSVFEWVPVSLGGFFPLGSAEAMESGNKFQAGFGPVTFVYKFTWWGAGECSWLCFVWHPKVPHNEL